MRIAAVTSAFFFALAVPAAAAGEKDTTPGNSHKDDPKVVICHKAGPDKTVTITVDGNSQVQAHLRHGDSLGACPTVIVEEPPVVIEPETPLTPMPEEPVVTGGTPTPAAPEEPAAPAPDEGLVAGERHEQQERKKLDRALAKQERKAAQNAPAAAPAPEVQAAERGETLPYTGLPAGLLALIGGSLIAGGLGLRNRL